jgi:hypothetical protein
VQELKDKLAETPNALAALSGQDARLADGSSAQPSLYERGCALIRAGPSIGTLRPSKLEDMSELKETELVLLIGSGDGVVCRVVQGQDAILRRLVVAIARAEEEAKPSSPRKAGRRSS